MTQTTGADSAPAGAPTVRSVLASYGNRGPGFDTVRLLAATGVMFHHSLGIKYDIVQGDWLFKFSQGYSHLGLMSVAVFFSISGFLVTPGLLKSGNVLEYLSRRFMRIMPLLAVVVVLTALVLGPILTDLTLAEYFSSGETWAYLRNITTSLRLQLPGVTNHLGTNSINNPLWTLRYEWLCYLIVAVSSVVLILRFKLAFVALWIATLIAFPMLFGFYEADSGKLGQLGNLLYLFGYFGAGVVLCLYSDRAPWSIGWLVFAFVALLIILASGYAHIVAPAIVTYLVIGVGLIRMPWSDFLSKADLSYGVYLTHALVLTILMNIYTFASPYWLFAFCLPLSYAAALATWTFIEKPALEHKSAPADFARYLLNRIPLGSTVLSTLEPQTSVLPAAARDPKG